MENEACWPVAVASYDKTSSLYTCDTLQLDGSGSYDPDGLDVEWDWTLDSAPADSELTSADIEETEDMSPVFVPDEPGTYVFTLTVFNGTEYSPQPACRCSSGNALGIPSPPQMPGRIRNTMKTLYVKPLAMVSATNVKSARNTI